MPRSSVRTIGGGIALALASAPVAATAQADLPTSLSELTRTPGYQANIARLFAGLPVEVFKQCPALVSKGSTVTVLAPVIMAPSGFPTSGAWKQSFPVSGCGNDTSINFFFVAKDEKISSTVAMPGDTHAGPLLQKDAFGYVMVAARPLAGDCADLHVRTTSFDGTDSGGAHAPWRETWTVSGCGKLQPIHVRFVPDATGTTVVASPRP